MPRRKDRTKPQVQRQGTQRGILPLPDKWSARVQALPSALSPSDRAAGHRH